VTEASHEPADPSVAAPGAAAPGRAELELKAMLDAAVDAVIVIDHRGTIATFNRAAERLFGWRAADVAGRNVQVLMPAPYRAEHDGYMQNYMRTGQARIIGIGREVVAQRSDGTVFPASLAVGEIPGSNPPRFVGFIHDITSRKAAVDALRRERDRAQSYLDLAEVMLLALDANGRIALINRKGCEILGWTEAELVGRDWFEHCVPERAREVSRHGFADVLAGRRDALAYVEDPIVTREGDTKLVAWRTTVVRDERGETVGTLSSGEDVTERRRAEQQLLRSESLLRAAQAIANLGNYEMHLPGGASLWSDQMYRIVGRDAADGPVGVGDFVAQLVHPDDRERFLREWQRAIAETGKFDVEYRLTRPDGMMRDVHSIAQVTPGPDGESIVVTGTMHDITERKQSEEETRQAQEKLTHVARLSTMGEMATGLAHEINQPLTAIATYAQAGLRMMNSPGGADPEDLNEAMKQITNQALRAGEVIKRLRAFVKNRATRTETLDLNRLIEDVQVLAESDARVNDMRLTLDLAPTVPPVSADPVQIQQVLLNLIRNAIDALNEAPGAPREIVVRTRNATDAVEVAVIDRGPGIPAKVADNLFNPFFTTKATGTGLGLAISRSIIRAHQGKLAHQPTPGGGTTFYFTLPPLPVLQA
jgi:two-component system, LuxR family, sensor kinase FixL